MFLPLREPLGVGFAPCGIPLEPPSGTFWDLLGPDFTSPEPLGSPPGPQLGLYTDPGTFAEPKSGPSAAYMQRIEGAFHTEGKVLSPAPVPV